MNTCETCGMEFTTSKDIDSTRFCCEHCRRVYIGRHSVQKKRENRTLTSLMAITRAGITNARIIQNKTHKSPHINHKPGGNCKFCGKECQNGNSLINHERLCKKNPDRDISKFQQYIKIHGAWNKGLTKETDTRVANHSSAMKEGYKSGKIVKYWLGKKHTDEEKRCVSETMKRKIASGEIEAPYKRNHYSKGPSYPEQYFINVFDNANLNVEYNFQVGSYQLDFANPSTKKYIEIDGDQHYLDKRIIEHDIERTQKLEESGWHLITRIKWSDFQKLSKEEKEKICKSLIDSLH